MEKSILKSHGIIALMEKLHSENRNTSDEPDFCEEKIDLILKELNKSYEEIIKILSEDCRGIAAVKTLSPEWKFMCLNFYCLHLLQAELKTNEFISMKNIQLLQKFVRNMLDIGICQNILPNLPFYKPLRKVDIEVKEKYYMLKGSVRGLFHYTYNTSLKSLLFSSSFATLLVGILQLSFCPLAKPSANKHGSFVMTEEFHDEVTCDQSHCREILYSTRERLTTREFLFYLSLMMKPSNPRWFNDALVQNLNFCLKEFHGIKSLFSLMENVKTNDCSLKPVVILARLVSMSSNSEDFDSSILPQIFDLLYKGDSDKGEVFLFGEILKITYRSNLEKGVIILDKLQEPLKNVIRNSDISKIDVTKLSEGLRGTIRVVSYVFVNSLDKLPFELIKKYLGIIFNIYMFLEDENCPLLTDLQSILKGYFKEIDKSEAFEFLENLIFNLHSAEYHMPLYNLNILTEKNDLKINFEEKNIKYDVLTNARSVLSLFNGEPSLENLLFTFLLRCLVDSKKYFPDVSLLLAEDEGFLSTFERKLAVFEILNLLASKDTVKKNFKENFPEELLDYFKQIFKNAIETDAHNNPEHDDFQSIFTIAIVLQEISRGKNCSLDDSGLMKTLKKLYDTSRNPELKKLLTALLEREECEKSPAEECDELEENIQFAMCEKIEMQGHGLIALKKMILSKHPKAVERKQFLFTIFKERLAHRDTYIYLAAINGVASFASLGTECTNMVLNTLCEEYRDFPTEEFGPDAIEMRLKVGEVLVKVSSSLGDMAPHYKALLLNTFLCGAKDEDHLVRASSLSNLGEICKVLGYKLGSIVTEILLCVHGIVSTDKHQEPRRAAIFVIRQLLMGLGIDMLSTMKDDMLVVYRTVKCLYENDKDDVLRLQCQLVLQEINHNMREILMHSIEVNKVEKGLVIR